ncbi:MAG: 1-(5-phosphoribosyl)-5-[(5-phosphoribosylamino)methylideneamino]imidazole-4-carboxamide isomerase [Nitrospiraceae bacterium]
MLIIPAIDLKDGRCVRLRQGDMAAETVYGEDVVGVAMDWQRRGASLIHVVDLNGAVNGEPKNLKQIEAILSGVSIRIQVGGGIRTLQTIRRYLSLGVWRVVLGTTALQNHTLLQEAGHEFPQRIVLGLDARNGYVAVRGWTSLSDTPALDLLRKLAGYSLGAVIYTDIARDGMLSGPNLSALKEVADASAFPVIASGGITRLEDLLAIKAMGPRIEGAIVGKALYDGKLDFTAALAATG